MWDGWRGAKRKEKHYFFRAVEPELAMGEMNGGEHSFVQKIVLSSY